MTIIEILELLVPFKAGVTKAGHVQRMLQEADLDALIAAERSRGVVTPMSPMPSSSGTVPYSSTKEFFHTKNSRGMRCFDEHTRMERERGIHNPDRGTSFIAQRNGHCDYQGCGELILKGDGVVLRSRMTAEQMQGK